LRHRAERIILALALREIAMSTYMSARSASMGFVVRRDAKTGAHADAKPDQVYRLPDGKIVRTVDGDLFERAVKAATAGKK